MKNLDPWPYGVGRCDIVFYLFVAGFLATTFLVLMNNAEGRAQKIATRNRIGRTRTLAGRVMFLPAILFGIYLIGLNGLPQFCEKFFSDSSGFKSVADAKNLIFSFMAICSSPVLFFFLFCSASVKNLIYGRKSRPRSSGTITSEGNAT